MVNSRESPCRGRCAPSRLVSRRGLIWRGAVVAAALSASVGRPATAAAKVPKTQAGYKDAPRAGMRCDRCVQFQPPAGCKIVEGAVNPNGSCDFFAPKPG